MGKRCLKCDRLLFIQVGDVKKIKSNNIEYHVNGSITVICKCNTINKF